MYPAPTTQTQSLYLSACSWNTTEVYHTIVQKVSSRLIPPTAQLLTAFFKIKQVAQINVLRFVLLTFAFYSCILLMPVGNEFFEGVSEGWGSPKKLEGELSMWKPNLGIWSILLEKNLRRETPLRVTKDRFGNTFLKPQYFCGEICDGYWWRVIIIN